jgi:predicted Kef-type K+ transport protein
VIHRYAGVPIGLTSYEQAAAAFLFFNFCLSVAATVFAMKAVDEIRKKQREEYNRLSVLSDTMQYEME